MSFSFATCERGRALGFLKAVYPSYEIDDTIECAKDLLDFVEKDIVRIQDPMMHGNSPQVIPSTNWKNEYKNNVVKACMKLTSKPKGVQS